ncbi:hypothetical protein OKJ48_13250 [Streptomyces kunmingensis]|uniref:Uncharacterized protein n=1 Tax=Streptomyces kunmingensis TaxID=68225 RepID=A0ABU6CAJ2_9ACTN|nr:hypothetical protein [Streptomyces kunmingensis]MEB3961206.1 hypothetical protein [Streptomyces kunmingensis]
MVALKPIGEDMMGQHALVPNGIGPWSEFVAAQVADHACECGHVTSDWQQLSGL